MSNLTEDELIRAVWNQIEDSEGYEKDELAHMRQQALEYYYNRSQAAPSVPGRSSLQSSDVADMVEAVLAQMMPAFEGDTIVDFEPLGDEDVDQARAESGAVEHIVMQRNNGHYELQQAVRDALLLRNGFIKIYLDERIDTGSTVYRGLTQLEYGDLIRNASGTLRGIDNGYTVKDLAEENGFYDVRVRHKTTTRNIMTRAVDPANVSWERDYTSVFLDDCRFFCERSYPTRSELVEMGYSKAKVADLNVGGNDHHLDSLARNQHSERRNWRGATPAEDIIELYECYIRIDANGDGVAELLKICTASKTLLEMQEVDFIPYCTGTPFLQPHRLNGLGLFDKLRYVQDQKTFTIRQWADNLNSANNARFGAVEGMVNMDDLTNSRPGGVVRMDSPDAIVPIVAPDVGMSCQAFLEYGDKMRSERGGASLDMQAAELQVAGDTAHGVERQMSAKEQLAALMTRTLAETMIRSLWLMVHRALRLYMPEPIQYQVQGEFVTVNPAEWGNRETVAVKAGLSLAERSRRQAALLQVVQNQGLMMQAGLYVSPRAMHNAQLDLARASGIDAPERYFTDPQSQEAQQAAAAQQQQAQQQAEYQQQLLELQRNIEDRAADNADAKVFEDARQFDEEMAFKYAEAEAEQETKEAELAITLARGAANEHENQSGAAAGESTTR